MMLRRLASRTSLVSNRIFTQTIYSRAKSTATTEEESFANVNLNLPAIRKPSILDQVKEKLGFQGSFRYSQVAMKQSGLRLYLCLEHQVDYDAFFKLCKFDDVFANWCLITYLHVWLISVRLGDEARSGLFVRRELVDAMWKDITERTSKLRVTGDIKKQSLIELYDIFNACLFGFDEGLLSDDAGLAASLWRHLLNMDDINDYSILVTLCDYVRKNVIHLQTIPEKELLSNGLVTFVKLNQESLDHNVEKINLLEKLES